MKELTKQEQIWNAEEQISHYEEMRNLAQISRGVKYKDQIEVYTALLDIWKEELERLVDERIGN